MTEPLDLKDLRVIQWSWLIGGSNDEYAIPPEAFERGVPFKMLKDGAMERDPAKEARAEDELYTPRKITVGRTNLRVYVFAERSISDTTVIEQVWERLSAKALLAADSIGGTVADRLAEVIPDSGALAEKLREAASDIRVHRHNPDDLDLAESMRRTAQILGLIPTCPQCQRWLIYRAPDWRFMENSQYVQCQHGHIFELVRITDLPEGKRATEAIQQLATGSDDLNKTQLEIAKLFLEGRLYAGHESDEEMQYELIAPPE